MKRFRFVGAAMLSVLLGASTGWAQQEQQGEKPKQEEQRGNREADKKAKPRKAGESKPEQRGKGQGQQKPPEPGRRESEPQRAQPQRAQPQAQRGQPQRSPEQRVSPQVQQQRVAQQQQRLTQYRQHLDQQQRAVQQHTTQLQQQNRAAQYRFQTDYVAHLHQQQVFLQNDRHPDYDRDPYFYAPPIYRYDRGGRAYEINQYGADLLRQAVNYGYAEGFRAGEADRQDHWRFGYEDSFAYQDANYGYNGYYVERDDYNYYFREGFRRGYEDGYYSRYQYGRHVNGTYSLLGAILSQVLGFKSIR